MSAVSCDDELGHIHALSITRPHNPIVLHGSNVNEQRPPEFYTRSKLPNSHK